jgi:hypothetical protein
LPRLPIFARSGAQSNQPDSCIKISITKDVTILPKAAPKLIPTAMSITFPLTANRLNALIVLDAHFKILLTQY